MREILFRGKRKDNGEWVEGSLEITHIQPLHKKMYDLYEIRNITVENKHSTCMKGSCEEVDPSTIGQYTGLTDKNGKRIFEGDIVKTDKFGEPNKWYIIKFDLQLGAFIGEEARHNMYFTTFDGDSDLFEVIGNIHDNLELLEVSE